MPTGPPANRSMTASSIGGFKRTELAVSLDFPALGLNIDQARLSSEDAPQALAAASLSAQAQSSGCSAVNGQTNTIDNGVNWDLGSFDFAADFVDRT